ncbi:MAG TPA: hypothetical protein VGH44_01565 [Candidatus Saccharimonadia bacterium]|jgi:hypothetical protein
MNQLARVTIPKSELRAQLDEAEAIKRKMAAMLLELETKTTGQPATKSGSWRHDPIGWLQRHGLPRSNPDR